MSVFGKAIPALICARLAFKSTKTGMEWTRFAQWDAVAVNLALGALFGTATVRIARL